MSAGRTGAPRATTSGAPAAASRPGSAVLVHGSWGNPEDWRWVRRLLEDDGVRVQTPDLPSHRATTAGLEDDAAHVREVLDACRPPVVAVGWSYGGAVVTAAADGVRDVVLELLAGPGPGERR